MYKMNEIVDKFCLSGEKVMLEMHLRQPGFTYSVCEPFIKNNIRIQKLKKKEIHDIKKNYIMLASNMIWLMEVLYV